MTEKKRYRQYRRALLGYRRIYKRGHNRTYCPIAKKYVCNPAILVEDKKTSMIVKDMFKLYLEGSSTIQIPKIIKEKYNFDIQHGAVYNRLNLEFYMGYEHGELHGFPALIDEETFYKVKELLKNKKKALKTLRKNKLGIYIRCGICGYSLRYNGEGYLRCILKKNHPDIVINLKKDDMMRQIKKITDRLGIKEEPKSYYHIIKILSFDGKQFSHELHDEYKKEIIAHPFLEYLEEPRTLEDIINHFSLSLSQVQERLTDLELQGLIEERAGGYYETI